MAGSVNKCQLWPKSPLLRFPVIAPVFASNVAKAVRASKRATAEEATRRAFAGAAHS